MDFEKLQKDVAELESLLPKVKAAEGPALKGFVTGLREIVSGLLKDRKEQIRPGSIFKDAAAKSLLPGDVAPRADILITRWGGNVTPQDPQTIKDDAARLVAVAEKTLPVLKAYKKDR